MANSMHRGKALGCLLALVCSAFGLMAQTAEDEAKALPDGPGREVTGKVCINCHDASNFRRLRLSRPDWDKEVGLMVDNGAQATDDELAAVVNYLAENFGPDSKIWVNTAPVSELKAVLGITAAQAVAVVDYRQANGNFKTWQDLLKVPQIDAKRIEDKKDLMAF
jgi:competence protein ComEA